MPSFRSHFSRKSASQWIVKKSLQAVAASFERLTNRSKFRKKRSIVAVIDAGSVLEIACAGPPKGPGMVNDENSQSSTYRTPEAVRDDGARSSGGDRGSPRGCERPDPGNRGANARWTESIQWTDAQCRRPSNDGHHQ